jgi:hypothetical protein
MTTKASSQDKISQLEKQIIDLQRELDAARKNSTSIWCKVFDDLIDSGIEQDRADELADMFAKAVVDWTKAQRAKINRKVSSMGVMPPYTDCLNDLIVSASNPETDHSDLLPPEEPDRDLLAEITPAVRIPTPPPSITQGDDSSLHMGPAKMLRVNVPKPRSRTVIPPSLPEEQPQD